LVRRSEQEFRCPGKDFWVVGGTGDSQRWLSYVPNNAPKTVAWVLRVALNRPDTSASDQQVNAVLEVELYDTRAFIARS
jgi:hypothetical protein